MFVECISNRIPNSFYKINAFAIVSDTAYVGKNGSDFMGCGTIINPCMIFIIIHQIKYWSYKQNELGGAMYYVSYLINNNTNSDLHIINVTSLTATSLFSSASSIYMINNSFINIKLVGIMFYGHHSTRSDKAIRAIIFETSLFQNVSGYMLFESTWSKNDVKWLFNRIHFWHRDQWIFVCVLYSLIMDHH